MQPQTAVPSNERGLRAVLARCSQGQIIALVHAKLVSLEERRGFEHARINVSHDVLVALAARVIANATPRRSGLCSAQRPGT